MVRWNSRLTLFKSLTLCHCDGDDHAWIKIDEFYDMLKASNHPSDKTQDIRKRNIVKETKKNHTQKCIDEIAHVSAQGVLRYVFDHSDRLLICKQMAKQVTSVLISDQNVFSVTSNKEIYDEVASTQLHLGSIEENLYNAISLSSIDIPTLEGCYENEFSTLEWKRIAVFEKHFSSNHNHQHLSYEALVSSKLNFWNKIKTSKTLATDWQSYSTAIITDKGKRRCLANQSYDPYIKGRHGVIHDPKKLDEELSNHLTQANVEDIDLVVCSECNHHCNHEPGVHIIIQMKQGKSLNERSATQVTALITTYLNSSKHETECSEIVFCEYGHLKNYMYSDNKDQQCPERFHIRDDVQKGKIPLLFVKSENATSLNNQQGNDLTKCIECYPPSHVVPLAMTSFDAIREWVLYVPLAIQIIMESFLNPTSFGSDNQSKTIVESKVRRLYFTYDILLNIFNKNHFGILQEKNTFELIMGSKSVSTVFKIASHSGASMSMALAEGRLKARGNRDQCYFSSYLQQHPLLYTSIVGGNRVLVAIIDCEILIVEIDNLVKLTYHSDPKPGEHRSQQICTLPITVKGVPADDVQVVSWHTHDCDGNENCNCKKDKKFVGDCSHLALELLEDEKEVLDRFKQLCTWGSPYIWQMLAKSTEWQEIMSQELGLEHSVSTNNITYHSSTAIDSSTSIPNISTLSIDGSLHQPSTSFNVPSLHLQSTPSTSSRAKRAQYFTDGDLDLSFGNLDLDPNCDESATSSEESLNESISSTSEIFPIENMHSSQNELHNGYNNSDKIAVRNSQEVDDLQTMSDKESNTRVGSNTEGDQPDIHHEQTLEEPENTNLYELMQGIGTWTEEVTENMEDMDLYSVLMTLEHDIGNKSSTENVIFPHLAEIMHKLSKEGDNSFATKPIETMLKELRFMQYTPPAQLVRHPPPATGRDDDIDKLKEVLDDVILKSGHDGKRGHKILMGPDNKIGENLLKLKARDDSYESVIVEFPLLHLRKSKITNLCSAYKDIGFLHLLMYMKDTTDQEWAKLIEVSHIDRATRYIRRLAIALNVAFLTAFIMTEPLEARTILLEGLQCASLEYLCQFEGKYEDFIKKGISSNAIFAAHHEIMVHCNEIIGLQFSERLGGTDGYNLLLAIVKEALPFSYLNGSAKYALFATNLLHEHYQSGPFVQKLKSSLYTSPHKGSDINFAIDTQREMDHQDITRSFRSGSTLSSVIPKMASVDFLVQDLQQMVNQQDCPNDHMESSDTTAQRSLTERLSLSVTETDIAYIFRGAEVILKRGGISTATNQSLINIYDGSSQSSPLSLCSLDRNSLDIGKFVVKDKGIVKHGRFGCTPKDAPNIDDYDGEDAIKHKAVTMKSTTMKRAALKLEKKKKTEEALDEEKRKRNVVRQKKKAESMGSKMNACQAVVKPDGSKNTVAKATRIRTALSHLLVHCYREKHGLPHSDDDSSISNILQEEGVLYMDNKDLTNLPLVSCDAIGVVTCEFAGIKFKKDHETGDQYLRYAEKVLQNHMKLFPNVHHMAICEEKYSFTPDLFKAFTRNKRSGVQSGISIDHLKSQEEIISAESFNKAAVTKTSQGKQAISKFLAQNASQLKIKHDVFLDIDSEYQMSKCLCEEENCTCSKHAIPIRCHFTKDGNLKSMKNLDVKQRKGEAEVSQIDWLLQYLPELNEDEDCVSLVLSGDIDAILLHMVALSHLWPRDSNQEFTHKVYVILQKPGSSDIYNITAIIRLIEIAFKERMIAIKIAMYLCFGGNDFVPSFYRITNKDILEKFLCNTNFLTNMIALSFDEMRCTSAMLNQATFIELIKAVYCPSHLNHKAFSFDEIRQMSVRVPKKSTQSTETRNPQQWMPPLSAINVIGQLIQGHCDYMLTAGFHDAGLPDVSACFINVGRTSEYNFGTDAHISSAEAILHTPATDLYKKMQENKFAQKKKKKGIIQKKSVKRPTPLDQLPEQSPRKGANRKRQRKSKTGGVKMDPKKLPF